MHIYGKSTVVHQIELQNTFNVSINIAVFIGWLSARIYKEHTTYI